jgi:hypothetical protein
LGGIPYGFISLKIDMASQERYPFGLDLFFRSDPDMILQQLSDPEWLAVFHGVLKKQFIEILPAFINIPVMLFIESEYPVW